ncbi:hypothetical protein LXL04_024016 [Taraxacum kok-saghyz]
MEATKEVSTMDNVTCSLTDDDLLEIKENFKMDSSLKNVVPTADQTINMAPEGFVGINHQFLKAGLRFPVFGFLKTILSHYNFHIAQLAPNSFRKIICFVMLSRALGIPPSLTLFPHFYVTLNAGDWVSFTRRQGVDEICDGIPSSIKKWKPEFLFVDVGEFSPNMVFGEHKNKAVDHLPELTPSQQLLVDQMKRKFTGATEVLEGHISDFLGPSVLDTALEEDSSMDSANHTESTGDFTSVSAKTVRRSHKGDRGARRPPSHPGRVNKEAFVLKKRSSSSSAGGSASPESEKSGSAPKEAKEVSPAKRRRLVCGGRHLFKSAGAPNQFPVSSSCTTLPAEVSTPLSPMYECPVSSDASMAAVSAAITLFPTVPVPPLPRKPMAIKAADSAFVKTLCGAGLGFGQFSSAIVSTPPPVVSSEKCASSTIGPVDPGDSCEAILNIPSVPSSPEAVVSETVPDSPVTAKASSVGGRAPHPTLMSLVVAAPAFQHPYMTSAIGRVTGLGQLSEEEGLDRARSLFTEVVHLPNAVMLRQRTRASKLAAQQTEYDRLSETMEKTQSTHASLSEENVRLARELQQMELRNQELTMELDGRREKQKESLEVRQTVKKQLEDVHRHREADLRRLEEVGQQFDSLKALFSEKVSGLDILCNQKEVVLKRQEAELQEQKIQLLGDLAWLLKQGVTASVRAILNSEEFGNLNAACQAASIQVGLTQACLEMKTKCMALEGEPLLYSVPQSQEELMDRFSEMTGHEYQLLNMLSTGTLGVESLKKYLDDHSSEEVHMADEGPVDVCAFGTVRADTKGSAQLNGDSGGDGGAIGEREDDGGKSAEDEDKVAEGGTVGDGLDKGDSQITGSDVVTEG